MPLYDFKCTCGKRFQAFSKIDERDQPKLCDCGIVAQRCISAPRVVADYPGYNCPVSGRWVEGRRAHEENLKRTGCRVREEGEFEANARKRKAREDAFYDDIGQTAEKLVAELPPDKKEHLAAEMSQGLDISVSRT